MLLNTVTVQPRAQPNRDKESNSQASLEAAASVEQSSRGPALQLAARLLMSFCVTQASLQ